MLLKHQPDPFMISKENKLSEFFIWRIPRLLQDFVEDLQAVIFLRIGMKFRQKIELTSLEKSIW